MDASKPQVEASLAPFLQGQRWFGGKARGLKAVRVVDWAPFPSGVRAVLTFVEVVLGDGATDLYFVPLTTGPGGETVVADALTEEAVRAALLEAIAGGKELTTYAGRVRAFPTTAFAELRGRTDESRPAVLAPPTSSNSLIKYGRRLLLKVFRRLEPGINPDLEIGRFLTERSRFDRIPRAAGGVEYLRHGSPPMTLAILQELVAHQADGWAYTLEELDRYFERASASREGPDAATAGEVVGAYRGAAAVLGRRTAELHLALADDHGNPAFAPEPLTPADLDAVTADSRGQAGQALAALEAARPEGRNREIEKLLESLTLDRSAPDESPVTFGKIRCHGDYHLGQVLRTGRRLRAAGFRGRADAAPSTSGGAKQSPLKDVAGMLRSFDYAANAGLFAFTRDRPDDFARLAPWAESWRRLVSAAFLREYRGDRRKGRLHPPEAVALFRPARRLRAQQGPLRIGLRTQQPARLGPHPRAGHHRPGWGGGPPGRPRRKDRSRADRTAHRLRHPPLVGGEPCPHLREARRPRHRARRRGRHPLRRLGAQRPRACRSSATSTAGSAAANPHATRWRRPASGRVSSPASAPASSTSTPSSRSTTATASTRPTPTPSPPRSGPRPPPRSGTCPATTGATPTGWPAAARPTP